MGYVTLMGPNLSDDIELELDEGIAVQ